MLGAPGGLLDYLMSLDDAPGPRMPRIENLAILGPVGVPSSRCTIAEDPIRALTGLRRMRPTSRRRISRRRNPVDAPLIRPRKSVQTTRASSLRATTQSR
jgi:hypothetical protein